MDPLSLSLGIAGVLPVVATVIRLAKSYYDGVKTSKESISLLITELTLLESALKSLDAFLESPDGKDVRDLPLDNTSVLRTCSIACSTKLRALESKLRSAVGAGPAAIRRLIWPLDERDHKKMIKELHGLTLWVQFSLSVDNIRILCGSHDQLTRLMHQQIEKLQSLAEAQETSTQMIQAAVQNHASHLAEQRDLEQRKRILEWISPPRHDERHRAAQDLRVPNTGGWFLDKPEFSAWMHGNKHDEDHDNILWCYGGPGTGKTVLASVVIDYLSDVTATTEYSVGFIYFDYKNQPSQSALLVLRSLLRQLAEAQPILPDDVILAFETHQDNQQPLTVDDARRLLATMTNSHPETSHYLVIDAIDECLSSQRRVFLQAMSQLAGARNVRVLVTGRPHVDEVDLYFAGCHKLEIYAHEEDLRQYIHLELGVSGAFDIIDEEFAGVVADRLVTVSRGMFLLAVLHLRTLVDLTSVGAIEDALGSLSESLSEAYRTTISRIQQLPSSRRELALQALQWACFARQPLTVEQLQELLSVKHGQTSRKASYRPALKIMLECCQGLLLVDPKTRLVRPSHYTVQEHLAENECVLFPQQKREMAQTCLHYLTFDDFSNGPARDRCEIQARIEDYPFLTYASCHWYFHVLKLTGSQLEDIHVVLWKFLGSKTLRAVAKQTQAFARHFVSRYWEPQECLSHTALHMACHGGLTSIVRQLLSAGQDDVNAQTYIGTTPIVMAAGRGSEEIVRLLLEHGADPYIENAYGNALHCAAESGKTGVIKILVEHDMPPQSDLYRWPPIRCTLDRDSADALETLLDLGASIEDGIALGDEGPGGNEEPLITEIGRALQVQMRLSSTNLVTLPLAKDSTVTRERRVDIEALEENGIRSEGEKSAQDRDCGKCNQCRCYRKRALFLLFAVEYNAANIIRVLARRGLVDINGPLLPYGASALHLARMTMKSDVVRVLEELGAADKGGEPCLDELDHSDASVCVCLLDWTSRICSLSLPHRLTGIGKSWRRQY